MYIFAVFAIVIAAATARPGEQIVSVTQDTLGNYNLKYLIEGISRSEGRDINGNVNGGFAYIDPHGILRKTEFTSGIHGYNAIGTDIPLPVADTPEVAIAKADHLATLRAAELAPKIPEFQDPHTSGLAFAVPLVKAAPAVVAPAPIARVIPSLPVAPGVIHAGIPETPEVLAARAEHFAAHAAVRANLAIH